MAKSILTSLEFMANPHHVLQDFFVRVQTQIALQHLSERYPDLSSAVPYINLQWGKRLGTRGLNLLLINFGAIS